MVAQWARPARRARRIGEGPATTDAIKSLIGRTRHVKRNLKLWHERTIVLRRWVDKD